MLVQPGSSKPSQTPQTASIPISASLESAAAAIVKFSMVIKGDDTDRYV